MPAEHLMEHFGSMNGSYEARRATRMRFTKTDQTFFDVKTITDSF